MILTKLFDCGIHVVYSVQVNNLSSQAYSQLITCLELLSEQNILFICSLKC